ncbi:GNAT family N-acetyltransferase [Anditalea andensis]|nr:GNAT family N-acetyltransferase [Anditalea andensis]
MNDKITNNLFEFWTLIGKLTNKLTETEYYSTISMSDSDWPNRIFALKESDSVIKELLKLNQEGSIPDLITVDKLNSFKSNKNFELLFWQKNMALNLKSVNVDYKRDKNIQQVKTKSDSVYFAKTASESFGYRVDCDVIFKIATFMENVHLFNYIKDDESLGCGIVFFDSYNNAGLHMIGTHPKGRRQGIGKIMTENLLLEAINNDKNFCVLHASLMGEPIYRKLGFETYGEIEIYKFLKNKGN